MAKRLREDQVASVLHALPEPLAELAMELRALVLGVDAGLDEVLAFRSLCYTVPGRPYGVIGGNVCMIQARAGMLQLSFLHGAALPDPEGLLRGSGKAKRHVELSPERDLPRAALQALVRAAIAHDPATD